ncbi:MAG: P1 family peptidase [Chloroflexi bacterium]|nr:P1 family peptidase [Chloroflexota bacterium]
MDPIPNQPLSPSKNERPRLNDLGLSLGLLEPGPLNAITDVAGVKVGHTTIHPPENRPVAACTGVSVILPHENNPYQQKVIAATHTINGHSKTTGLEQVREMGVLETPIALTNTLCVGRAWDALVTWTLAQNEDIGRTGISLNPVVGECNDMVLNDLRARHVREEHVLQALGEARSGEVEEGAVGAGTGMICYGFKGGIGTSSRKVGDITLGALVLANFGSRSQLTIGGVPVGRELLDWPTPRDQVDGSVIIVIATDAPLSARQLGRIARRTGLGLARTGSTAGNTSGDVAIAFSTAQLIPQYPQGNRLPIECLVETEMNPLFQATIEATEEAVVNALLQATTTTGREGRTIYALPVDRLVELMQRYGHHQAHLPFS